MATEVFNPVRVRRVGSIVSDLQHLPDQVLRDYPLCAPGTIYPIIYGRIRPTTITAVQAFSHSDVKGCPNHKIVEHADHVRHRHGRELLCGDRPGYETPGRPGTFGGRGEPPATSRESRSSDVRLGPQSGVPIPEQAISLEGRELSQPSATMRGLGVSDNAMLLLKRKAVVSGGRCVSLFHSYLLGGPPPLSCTLGGQFDAIHSRREASQDAEMMRLQILGNPDLLRQLQQVCPFRSYPIPSPRPRVNGLYDRPNPNWLMRRNILPRDSLRF
jgi:hypothetical protein